MSVGRRRVLRLVQRVRDALQAKRIPAYMRGMAQLEADFNRMDIAEQADVLAIVRELEAFEKGGSSGHSGGEAHRHEGNGAGGSEPG